MKTTQLFKTLTLVVAFGLLAAGCARHNGYYIGSGKPRSSLGIEEDLYLDSETGDEYMKTFKGWYRVGNKNRQNNDEHQYKISTETYSVGRWINYDDFEVLSLIKWAGFDCFDYSLYQYIGYNWTSGKTTFDEKYPFNQKEYANHFKEVRRFADQIGLECNQVHTTYPIESKDIMESQPKCLKIASILGAKVAAIHPMIEETEATNIEAFKKLATYAKKHKVNIGIENSPRWIGKDLVTCPSATPDSLKNLVDGVASKYCGAVIDTGHASVYHEITSIPSYFTTLGSRVLGVHLHDGDFVHDCHVAPFSRDFDWQAIVDGMKTGGYQGYLTLEAIFSVKEKTYEKDLLKLKNSAERIRSMMEAA